MALLQQLTDLPTHPNNSPVQRKVLIGMILANSQWSALFGLRATDHGLYASWSLLHPWPWDLTLLAKVDEAARDYCAKVGNTNSDNTGDYSVP